jgi:hypothetical protein
MVLLFAWIAVSTGIIYKKSPKMQDLAVMFAASTSVSILATFLLSHPGKSQAYFYWSIVPILVVAILYALSKLSSIGEASDIFNSGFVAYATYGLILILPWTLSESEKLKFLFAFPIVACFVFLLLLLRKNLGVSVKRTLTYVVLLAALVSFFAQPFRFRADTWSVQVSDGTNGVSNELIGDMRKLKEFSKAYDLVITNRICGDTSPSVFQDCGPGYWFLSAYAERKVFFETYAYVMNNEIEPAKKRVSTISRFVSYPSDDGVSALWNEGVRWIFIDKTRSYSDYSTFARLRLETSSSQIWEIYIPE